MCPSEGQLVEIELSRIATQYREAAHLKGYMAAVLGQVEHAARATCIVPDRFDLGTAVGEQLTFIGRRMGFPRCHCVCDATPVFGFVCEDGPDFLPIAGFCEEGTWIGCGGVSDLCISDDEAYRKHLFARRYQMLGLFDIESLGAALRAVWGPTAWVPEAKRGRVVISPGRNLASEEARRLSVTLRALPVAPGIQIAMHFGSAQIAGFGAGWAGFCLGWPTDPVVGFECRVGSQGIVVEDDGLVPVPLHGFSDPIDDGIVTSLPAYTIDESVIIIPGLFDPTPGFCNGMPGFCVRPVHGSDDRWPVVGFCEEAVWAECAPMPAPWGYWLCPVDIDPYSCDPPPQQVVIGFISGLDGGEAFAGFCDESSTWADCLK